MEAIPAAVRKFKILRPTLPEGQPLYAVGDIHGCHDQLQSVVREVLSHAAGRIAHVAFIGDYIDRGPASLQVWDWAHRHDGSLVKYLLDGNHEYFAEQTLYGTGKHRGWICREWLRNGGIDTLRHIMAHPERLLSLDQDLIAQVQARLRAEHFAQHADILEWGKYVLVHASINPTVELESQSIIDTLWSRAHRPLPDRIVIHGHTVDPFGPDLSGTVVNIDQGVVRSKRLTCVALWPGGRLEQVA